MNSAHDMTPTSVPQKQQLLGMGFCLLAALGFSGVSIFGKLGLTTGLEPLNLLSARFSGAFLLLVLGLVMLRGRDAMPGWRRTLTLMLLGGIGLAGQTWLFFLGLDRIPVSLNILIYRTYPLFVAIVDWILNRRRPGRVFWLALCIALLGLVLTLGPENLVRLRSEAARGSMSLLFPLAAAGLNAVYLVLSERPIRSSGSTRATVWILAGAALSMSLIGRGTGALDWGALVPHLRIVAGLIVLSTILPVLSFLAGIVRVGPTVAALLTTVEPILTVLLAIALLSERLSLLQAFGGVLLLFAVWITIFGARSDRP